MHELRQISKFEAQFKRLLEYAWAYDTDVNSYDQLKKKFNPDKIELTARWINEQFHAETQITQKFCIEWL